MTEKAFYTTGELAEMYGRPEWRVRRIVDTFGEQVPRAGLYRMVPAALLDAVAERLGVKPVGVVG